ncbi:xanthine dehydrogenase [Desulfuribacillus stibiiarsenatis]|uniref:Xanthine dehydrogenase n=1 Tax=Desulfuribacillus stibiiarsenatis TaxID=1390249 RepID=A0A1E5L4M2_9FIRM|nr:xanthine dehydrogenase [Desulfuribacillus stibiiarsenatis]
MISFDFEYYKPTSTDEAVSLYHSLDDLGKQPMYFSGGTELITYGRVNNITTGAVIDLKGIPECLELKASGNRVIIGAAISLTKIREARVFPFLSKAIVEIADHTARNKITLGGNICANIIYRETVLPLLLTDSQVVIATNNGLLTKPITQLFQQTLQLQKGEFLVQVQTDHSNIDLRFLSVKRRRQWDVGYPLITTAALWNDGKIKTAFSGLCEYPFVSEEMNQALNDDLLPATIRVEQAIERIPAPVLDDVNGSAAYRKFVLKNILLDVLESKNPVD